jgi:hypothetical protein
MLTCPGGFDGRRSEAICGIRLHSGLIPERRNEGMSELSNIITNGFILTNATFSTLLCGITFDMNGNIIVCDGEYVRKVQLSTTTTVLGYDLIQSLFNSETTSIITDTNIVIHLKWR